MKNLWLHLSILIGIGGISAVYGEGMVLILVPLFLFAIFSMHDPKKRLLFYILFFLFMSIHTENSWIAFQSYELKEGRFQGIGTVVEKGEGYYKIKERKGFFPKKIRLYTETNLDVGKDVEFRGTFINREPSMNPGSFNSELHDLSTGISFRIKGNSVKYTGKVHPLLLWRENIKKEIQEIYKENLLPEQEQIVSAMVLGMDPEEGISQSFQNVGLIHLLSISGLHIGVFLGILDWIGKKAKFSLWFRKFFVHTFLVLYLFVTGWPIGAVRIYLALFFFDLGKMRNRPVDLYYALFFSSTIVLLKNPFSIFHYGFLFSYGSVLGIYFLYEKIQSWIPIKIDWIRKGLAISLAVNGMIFPLLLSIQGKISILSILLNVWIVPVFSFVLMLSIALIPLHFVPFMGGILGIFLDGTLGMSLDLFRYSSQFPINITIPFMGWGFSFFYIFSLYFLGKGWVKNFSPKMGRCIVIQILCILFISAGIYQINRPEGVLTQLYVGQGDSVLLETRKGNIMIDTGGSPYKADPGSKYTLSYLKRRGISTLDYVFVSHFDADHIQGILSLSPEIKIKHIVSNHIPYDKELYEAIEEKIQEIEIWKEISLSLGDFHLRSIPILEKVSEDENANSMVLDLEYRGKHFLYTGDLPLEYEDRILEKLSHVDVLKVGHHGSKTSTSEDFLEGISPQWAIISAGRGNSYGHPHEEVINRLKESGVSILSTMNQGSLHFIFKEGRVEIQTHLPQPKITYQEILVGALYFAILAGIFYWGIDQCKKVSQENGINRIV
ncbi:DNA internalization-related competence protein ComEC/Rec2 [Peptoniphilus sp. KCTC 25270]|uniref:DNA internalization-related competence protein ComEC/Rec2 n=1 Tax=Peptoniphilus sp. KCTC 25270 TaxID=2897414 RepID=UPI001E5106E6|nr:DNA internalization-related competence protein ComEC/Rec2 [Peptoniphilus sp. KCTC 25270]MCD1146843.1 DNA internalization-related competence protein ComEC/Rec2 [Peptoniphilus sp. KCTC 25270]